MVRTRKTSLYRVVWLLLAVMSAPVSAETAADAKTAKTWLDRMSHSFRELNYQGTFSYQQGQSIRSFRITHAVINGEEYERLDYLDGKRRNIVRRGHALSCIYTGHKLIRFMIPVTGSAAGHDHADQIANNYRLEIAGQGRIAGRQVINLNVQPRDTHRYGYRLALDKDSGLLVRSEMIGDAGKILERFQFVELKIGGEIPKSYFDGVADNSPGDHPRPPAQVSGPIPDNWRVGWVPSGFTTATVGDNSSSRGMVTYTDGLTVFSVFLEPAKPGEDVSTALAGAAHKGATTAYFRSLMLSNRPYKVTVVGEIPQRTARRVAESVDISGH